MAARVKDCTDQNTDTLKSFSVRIAAASSIVIFGQAPNISVRVMGAAAMTQSVTRCVSGELWTLDDPHA
jgi:hypothetical protein